MVPIAPSNKRMRSVERISLNGCILRIADFQLPIAGRTIHSNWQLKNPALNNAGLQIGLKFFGFAFRLPELFSWLFCVAASRLNSPRFLAAYTLGGGPLSSHSQVVLATKRHKKHKRFFSVLLLLRVFAAMSHFLCQHDCSFKSTESSGANKY